MPATRSSNWRRFAQDRRGSVLVLFTVLAPVLIGMVGLAADGGRAFILQSSLQDIADAAALAGAAELDGKPGAMARAKDKAVNYLANSPVFASSTAGLQVEDQNIDFYSALCAPNPPIDNRPTTIRCPAASRLDQSLAANDKNAVYIYVRTVTRSFSAQFIQAVRGAPLITTNAEAIAGTTTVACAVQPLMLCNPWGTDDFSNHVSPGQMLYLKRKAGVNNTLAGNFGLLDPPGQERSSAGDVARLLSSSSPNFCFINTISVRTGSVTSSVEDGIGDRFDMNNPPAAGGSPAPNVIKGILPKGTGRTPQCPKSQTDFDTANTYPMPRDSCMPALNSPPSTADTCTNSYVNAEGDRLPIGNGNWSAQAATYWNFHHTGSPPAGLGDPTSASYITRYKLYLREAGCNETTGTCTGTPDVGYAWKPTDQEAHAPLCSGVAPGGLDRRIIYVNIADCSTMTGGTKTSTNGDQLAKFFLTEPSTDGGIYAEFISVSRIGDADGKLHKIVQLYR